MPADPKPQTMSAEELLRQKDAQLRDAAEREDAELQAFEKSRQERRVRIINATLYGNLADELLQAEGILNPTPAQRQKRIDELAKARPPVVLDPATTTSGLATVNSGKEAFAKLCESIAGPEAQSYYRQVHRWMNMVRRAGYHVPEGMSYDDAVHLVLDLGAANYLPHADRHRATCDEIDEAVRRFVHIRLSSRVTEAPAGSAVAPSNTPTPAVEDATPKPRRATHSSDFTEVNWYGTPYTFTLGVQSRTVAALWAEYEGSGLALHNSTIAERANAEQDNFRVDMTFRDHPAMNTMIVRGGRSATWRLAAPPLQAPTKIPKPAKARRKTRISK